MTVRLLIDGMNVIGSRPTGWWRDVDGAVRALVSELGAYAARSGEDLTVVFDRRPEGFAPEEPEGVRVAFAGRRGRDAADDEIVRLVEEDPDPAGVTVVTSDATLAERSRSLGALVESAGAFRRRLDGEGGGTGPG